MATVMLLPCCCCCSVRGGAFSSDGGAVLHPEAVLGWLPAAASDDVMPAHPLLLLLLVVLYPSKFALLLPLEVSPLPSVGCSDAVAVNRSMLAGKVPDELQGAGTVIDQDGLHCLELPARVIEFHH